jgi:hypothetical protein
MPQQDVTIASWPSEPMEVTHLTDPERTPRVDMNMNMRADRPVPVCFTLCEPICARSDYTIGLSIFDNPVVRIRIVGETRVQACRDQTDSPPSTPDCVDFTTLKANTRLPEKLEHDGAVIELGDATNTVSASGTVGLVVPAGGMRVSFPSAVTAATVRLVAAERDAVVEGRAGDSLVTSVQVSRAAGVQHVDVPGLQLTTIAINGEGTIVLDVCGRRADERDRIY